MDKRRVFVAGLAVCLLVAISAGIWLFQRPESETPTSEVTPQRPEMAASQTSQPVEEPSARESEVASTAKSSPTDDNQAAREDVVEGVVTDGGLVLDHPLGAILEIESGDLPVGTTVRLATVGPPDKNLVDELQPDGITWSIEADAEPEDYVSFSLPFSADEVPAGALPYIATYDELTEMWLPGETEVQANTLRTELPNFSLKTWILDRVQTPTGWVSWFEYQLFKVFGSRGSEPDCSNAPAPEWIREVNTVDDPNAQLFGCVRAHGDGFAIATSNNRGYPVALELNRPFASVEAGRIGVDIQGLGTLIAHLVAVSDQNRVPLGPTETALVIFDPLDSEYGLVDGHVRRDTLSMLMFLSIEIANKTGVDLPLPSGKSLGLWNLECFGKAYNSAQDATSGDMISAGNQLTGCMKSTLETGLRDWGLQPDGRLLWSQKDLKNYPASVSRMVGGLRLLWALEVTKWASVAADVMINDATPEADLVDIGVRWSQAPVWGAGGVGGIWLHALPTEVTAEGDSGHQIPASLGEGRLPQSTAAWVACSAEPATLSYQLDGNYGQLVAILGLADHTPDGLETRFTFTGDSNELGEWTIRRGDAEPIEIDVTGVQRLTIGAQAVVGECTASPTPYGVLGDAYLVPIDLDERDLAPESLLGTWSGQMTQPSSSNSPYSVDVVFMGGAIGQEVARVAYDDLGCSGVWTLVRVGENGEIVVRESITRGGGCSTVNLEVSNSADGSMSVMEERGRAWADLEPAN